MASVLSEAYFHDEAAAFAALEGLLWPEGAICPHCGGTERINRLEGVKDKKGRVRLGLWKCYDCRGQFTVRKGTIFEDSKVGLHLWFQAAYLMCASKKGVSSNQLHRTLGVTLKTAWFMSHRLREAMRQTHLGPLGGEGRTVEFDETWVGGKEKNKHANKRTTGNIGGKGKEAVLSLVERGGTGSLPSRSDRDRRDASPDPTRTNRRGIRRLFRRWRRACRTRLCRTPDRQSQHQGIRSRPGPHEHRLRAISP